MLSICEWRTSRNPSPLQLCAFQTDSKEKEFELTRSNRFSLFHLSWVIAVRQPYHSRYKWKTDRLARVPYLNACPWNLKNSPNARLPGRALSISSARKNNFVRRTVEIETVTFQTWKKLWKTTHRQLIFLLNKNAKYKVRPWAKLIPNNFAKIKKLHILLGKIYDFPFIILYIHLSNGEYLAIAALILCSIVPNCWD